LAFLVDFFALDAFLTALGLEAFFDAFLGAMDKVRTKWTWIDASSPSRSTKSPREIQD
jgi:hypothetical protein